LKDERLLSRPHCALSELLVAKLRELGAQNIKKHEVPSMEDMPGLVQAKFGVGIWPLTRKVSENLAAREVSDVDMRRWVHVHTVFGRRLTAGASTLIGLLRAKDWSSLVPGAQKCGELVH
jgi:hypothetical protein